MEFSDKILKYFNEHNIQPATIAKATGIDKSTFSKWKSKPTSKVDFETVHKIVSYLNISIDFLLTGEEKSPSLEDDEQELLNYYKKLPDREQVKLISRAETLSEIYAEQVKEPDPMQLIPTYYISNRVSAGFGEYLEDYEQGKTVYVPDSPESRKADFVLTVSGDSMEPKFHDGDNILVRSQPTVEIGQIGIFDVDGEGFVKKLGEGQLISLNSKYPNIPLKDKYFKCFGLVLGITEIIKQ